MVRTNLKRHIRKYNSTHSAMSVGDYKAFKILTGSIHHCDHFRDGKLLSLNCSDLFARSGRDPRRQAIFLRLINCRHCLTALKRRRANVVRETCKGGHRGLVKSVMERLCVMAQDLDSTRKLIKIKSVQYKLKSTQSAIFQHQLQLSG